MAVVTFSYSGGTTTLWQDGAGQSGVGPIRPITQEPMQAWLEVPLPRGNGVVLVNNGIIPGSVVVQMMWEFSSAEYNAHRAAVAAIRNRTGTLTVAPGQAYTYAFLRQWLYTRDFPLEQAGVSGTVRHLVTAVAVFGRYRV